MYKYVLFIFILVNLCTVSVVRAGGEHLLPQPQNFVVSKGTFTLGKTRITSPVLLEEWKNFVTERGVYWAMQTLI